MVTFHTPELVVNRLGWVLVHSLWQIALLALVAMACARGMQRCSAAVRYAALLTAMFLVGVSPLVTWLVLPGDATVVSDRGSGDLIQPAAPNVAPSPLHVEVEPAYATATTEPLAAQRDRRFSRREKVSLRAAISDYFSAAADSLRPWLTTIVCAWWIGVLTFSTRPFLSLYTVRRLRHVGVTAVPDSLRLVLNQTATRLRLQQAVDVLQSTLVNVPVAFGYFRPVILLPMSLITSLPSSQLEAILAHELAHIRRHDYLVNLAQTVVETVFFYHPAVWWLSNRIRAERENCCDDLAVTSLDNRAELGRALLTIAELRGPGASLVLGANGGSLLVRVQRIAGIHPHGGSSRSSVAAPLFCLAFVAMVFALSVNWGVAMPEEKDETAAETDSSKKQNAAANPKIETVECRVRVIDSEGQPVKGAEVTPSGFRTHERPSTGYGWHEPSFGPQPHVKTDAAGIAVIKVPKFASDELKISKVGWLVDHRDYVISNDEHEIGANPAEVQLKDGYRIAATAIDADSQAMVKSHLYARLGGIRRSRHREWTLAKSGILVSRVFDEDQFTLRLIHLPPDKPARFSELITIDQPEVNGRVFLKKLPLKRGTRVQGRLNDAVPRPVTGGKVAAFISAGTQHNDQGKSQLWYWHDRTDIKPDGSFELASLPRGDIVQLIAVCDGWVSTSPKKAEIAAVVPWRYDRHIDNMTLPQVFSLDEATIEPTIRMSAAATCEVKVVDPRGKQLAGAEVSMWPNHYMLRYGSTILGNGSRSAELLRALEKGPDIKSTSTWNNPFIATTNAEGIAVIRNLPGSDNIGLHVAYKNFVQQTKDNLPFTYVGLKSGETTGISIRMEPKQSSGG